MGTAAVNPWMGFQAAVSFGTFLCTKEKYTPPYNIPITFITGRPTPIQTITCNTVMMKPIFHHSPCPMKPAPKKIGVTPQP